MKLCLSVIGNDALKLNKLIKLFVINLLFYFMYVLHLCFQFDSF